MSTKYYLNEDLEENCKIKVPTRGLVWLWLLGDNEVLLVLLTDLNNIALSAIDN